MNSPENVPPITDVRFAGWDKVQASLRQVILLRSLLASEGVNPQVLYGGGFTSLEDLSRWGASWGISYLEAAQEARWVEQERRRVEEHNAEVLEQRMKSMIADVLRGNRVRSKS